MIELDSDRAGSGAAVLRYTESCDRGPAVRIPSDEEGAVRWANILGDGLEDILADESLYQLLPASIECE